MKFRIKNKKNNTYYKSTPFKGQFHWTIGDWYLFKKEKEAQGKIDEIVSIKRLTIDDLVIESVK